MSTPRRDPRSGQRPAYTGGPGGGSGALAATRRACERIGVDTLNVWITGASSGIGEAVARAFAARGARVLLSARRESELARVAAALGERARVLPLDLEDTAGLADKAARALAEHGPIDIMVHNGGISQRSRAIDTRVDVDERIMRINYLGAVALTKGLLPSMVARRRGHFVVISSLVGRVGTPLRSGYSASKHALHGFFDSLRAEHHDDGLHVTLICPGFVRTDVSVNALTGDGSPQGTMDTKTAGGITPEACAARILRAVDRREEEVNVGGWETIAVPVRRYFPTLYSRLIRRARVT